MIKGGFALSTYLLQNNLNYYARKTTDIDLAFSDKDIWKEFFSECSDLFSKQSKFKLKFELTGYESKHHSWNNGRLFFKVSDKYGQLFYPGIDTVKPEISK